MQNLDLQIFDLSPIPMWLQDFSGVKKVFERWASEGIEDFEAFLLEDTTRLQECLNTIQTLHVNKSTLRLYEAQNLDEILASFLNFLTPEITTFQIKFFVSLWNNKTEYTIPVVNYTCLGKQIDVQLRANIMPGHEDTWKVLLLTTENISDYQNARRFAESIFLHSPTALWVKDFSGIKKAFDTVQLTGSQSFNDYLNAHPNFIEHCFKSISSINVNEALLSLFKATDKEHFDQHLSHIFKRNIQDNFKIQLSNLWNSYKRKSHDFNYKAEYQYLTLDGSTIYVLEELNVFPDSKDTWDTVQVSYVDITERKLLENHLKYISTHDQLTQLFNRSFFNDEIKRMNDAAAYPIACIYLDINGLKRINDEHGHHHGDQLLQRFALILKQSTQNKSCSVSRVGGDEFVILMPFSKEYCAQKLLQEINSLIQIHNTQQDHKISVASGYSSINKDQCIESLIRIADQNMYREKRNHYELNFSDIKPAH
jgi:diguanylate cyclase (GGDEF)-like protein